MEAAPQPASPVLIPPSLLPDRVQTLVASAALAVQTEGAVLLLVQEGDLVPAVRRGETGARFELSPALAATILHTDLFVGNPQSTHSSAAQETAFFASVPVLRSGELLGVLAVLDAHPHHLSGAQEYVLRTLATEISDQLELHELRHIALQERTVRSAQQERLRLLESVVVNANDAVLITEAEPVTLPGPRIVYANAAFTRTTGYSLEEVLGKTPRILQGEGTEDAARQKLKKSLKRWKPIELELLNYRKDGTPFWVELSIVPVADEKGWFTHWVSVQRDITERKANEENALRFRLAQLQNQELAIEVQERKRIEAELAHTAFHDDLTGLRNRAYFMDKLKQTVERPEGQTPQRSGVIFLDLDGFKLVNDTMGHSVGDLMLIEVARRLKLCSRPHDTISRIGGDEFTILCDDLSGPQEIISVAERILQELTPPMRLANSVVTAAISLGISVGHYTDPEHILRDADIAMYRAKREGGSRYALFDEQMNESAKAALRTRVELRSAIETRQFEVFYQPILNTLTGEICAAEALLRWRHPERGLVPPLDFIPIAEETGLIVELGHWVLHEVCRHLCLWATAGTLTSDFRISVNVSSRQLDEAGFLRSLEDAMAEHGVPANRLELEITESVFLKNADRIGALFNRIRSLGVRIAFDDFGTGYSSLSYLERYPIDTLKIDQTFVKRLGIGHTNTDICRMIIGLAEALDVAVSAEGVENTHQRDALQALGCPVVQGYLYSRPVPFADFTAMLACNAGEELWETPLLQAVA